MSKTITMTQQEIDQADRDWRAASDAITVASERLHRARRASKATKKLEGVIDRSLLAHVEMQTSEAERAAEISEREAWDLFNALTAKGKADGWLPDYAGGYTWEDWEASKS